jgi:hypothetical protein
LVRASSAARALRRINELCGVPCTVLGRQVFFADEHQRDCAGRWQVRTVRLSVKASNLMTRNYVADGPAAVFVASAAHARHRRLAPPRLADDRAGSRRSSPAFQAVPPISGQA